MILYDIYHKEWICWWCKYFCEQCKFARGYVTKFVIILSFTYHLRLWRYTCLLLLISMLGHSKRYSNRKETSCLSLLNAGFVLRVSDTKSTADWMPADKPTELWRIKLKKTWTPQPVPMINMCGMVECIALYKMDVITYPHPSPDEVISLSKRI